VGVAGASFGAREWVACFGMSSPGDRNRRYLLTLWAPVLLVGIALAIVVPRSLRSGKPEDAVPVAAVGVAFGIVLYQRTATKRNVATALLSPEPKAFCDLANRNVGAVPHGVQLAAANVARINALYGRFDEAESALSSVSWDDCPPILLAQRSVARAVLAYARGDLGEGRTHSVRAIEEAEAPELAPGATKSAMAFRMHRNLGLALEGRANDTTEDELEVAHRDLPLLGQILAAWGLAALAKTHGRTARLRELRAFLEATAPHFKPIYRSLDGIQDEAA
jgi:hypothetical protein